MDKFYITTTLPYVNSDPHIGFAMEIIRADVVARVKRARGNQVWFNTGTDEHGQKIYQKAVEEGVLPQEYCDRFAEKFKGLKSKLNLSNDTFIRTTDKKHIKAAQDFWTACFNNGDIYKKNYQVKYCVGCELEKTDSDLVDNKCPDHPNYELELRDEENYFFRFSKYQEKLLDFYKKNPDFVCPDFRMKEITNFVESGLSDFSISRLKSKMPWGVEVPGDRGQVMYVWFDALVNYISVLGWSSTASAEFGEYWPGVQVCGKDNLRQQSAMWQAMLMSAGLPNTKRIYVNGFILSDGVKMSKSLGNVIDPLEWVEKYGTDAVRYFLLSSISSFEDGDATEERFKEVYTAGLVNGLGNLTARVAAMIEKAETEFEDAVNTPDNEVFRAVEEYNFALAIELIWKKIKTADTIINEKKAWSLTGVEQKEVLSELVRIIRQVAVDLDVFLPEMAKKIQNQFGGEKITKSEHLFARLK
ncbi:methionine--tRNA ligase [Candidatus Collierbacteria bacterium RIFOXYD1_FULL_40_9]|uniref:Methionine--tRNA ligase n=1 Tax=Candidatus Collierbacteria bacterium RIFOXYD1_FULL_40_9 TaxID=1817731 RepID=A0A1F5FTQ9_9BACT|nr:MAG: methionine--tRNA ligase [Candidatus Collierbacteria bacterium RIFOXYD1_FULL_40_9]